MKTRNFITREYCEDISFDKLEKAFVKLGYETEFHGWMNDRGDLKRNLIIKSPDIIAKLDYITAYEREEFLVTYKIISTGEIGTFYYNCMLYAEWHVANQIHERLVYKLMKGDNHETK